jgi:hypothetical protein
MRFVRRVPSVERRAWSVKEWGHAVSLSKATCYRLMAAGQVKFVNIGKARRIITSPAEFLASLERDV